MKIRVCIEVEAEDIDWHGSSVVKSIDDGRALFEVECIGSYQGLAIDEMDCEKAEEYLIELERDKAQEAGLSDIPVNY